MPHESHRCYRGAFGREPALAYDQAAPHATSPALSAGPSADSPPPSTSSPREALLATLARSLAELAAAGDLEAALAVHEAMSKLLK
jgi:hypothetical protein